MTAKMNEKLAEYARLTVRQGVNVAPGQTVCVSCPVLAADFGRMVASAAYEAGARDVVMLWTDDKSKRLRYLNSPLEVFQSVPEWASVQSTTHARLGAAMINIIAEDPDALAGVDGEKLIASSRASKIAHKEFYSAMDRGELRWTIVAYPCAEWAKRVFPDLSESKAIDALWSAIFETVRIGRGDTVKKWEKHDRVLKARAKKLNKYSFAALRCENSLGTAITVGLADRHIWKGGSDHSAVFNGEEGRDYFPNMPTEEIFTMPHRERVDGIVYSALPLSERGQLIDKFWLRFEGGKVVDFGAETGYDALKALLDTDEGARYIGEIALIPYSSPISQQGILYYNTLFDENASCHMALGDCYPDSTEGGEAMSEDEITARGGNHSAVHVDFMFGTSDMKITGISADGKQTPVFENGEFVL